MLQSLGWGCTSLTDWREYHKKRQGELEGFLRAAKAVVKVVGPPRPLPRPAGERGRGRPGYASDRLLLVNLLRMQLKMSYRDMESYLRANPGLRGELGLETVPGRDTIHRAAQALTEAYLERFNAELTHRSKKTTSSSASTPPVSRSQNTRHVGALPRTRNATRNAGSNSTP